MFFAFDSKDDIKSRMAASMENAVETGHLERALEVSKAPKKETPVGFLA